MTTMAATMTTMASAGLLLASLRLFGGDPSSSSSSSFAAAYSFRGRSPFVRSDAALSSAAFAEAVAPEAVVAPDARAAEAASSLPFPHQGQEAEADFHSDAPGVFFDEEDWYGVRQGPAAPAERADLPAPFRAALTGRERRASRGSFAPFGGGGDGAPDANVDGRFGNVVGSTTAGGYAANGLPPATDRGRRSPTPGIVDGGGAAPPASRRQRAVITGSERRASFGSFDRFAPAHEPPRRAAFPEADETTSATSAARAVAETLSSLPVAPLADEAAIASPPVEDRSAAEAAPVEVPMDTPARQSLPPHLSLEPIPGKGLGVIAHKPYSKGEFVAEYQGELLSEEVKDRRYLTSLRDQLTDEDREWIQSRLERGQGLTGCYLYGVSLDDENVYQRFGRGKQDAAEEASAPPRRIFVDAEDEHQSLWTRFVNHASPPGNNLQPKSVPESYDGNPRVWFMAKRDIEAGEELCFDYGKDYWLEGDEVH
ncbi:hypothetical protein ACHAWF_009166 [Thalassiosira exigua]